MQVYFGAKAIAQDGREIGTVAEAVYYVERAQVTHVIVNRDDGRPWLVPLSIVQGTTEEQLVLYTTAAQAEQIPQELEPGLPLVIWQEALKGGGAKPTTQSARAAQERALSPRESFVSVSRDVPVNAVDGPAGTLLGLKLGLYDNSLSDLVVETAGEDGRRTIEVPARWIGDVGPAGIRLAGRLDQVSHLLAPEAGPYLSVEGEEESAEGRQKSSGE